MAEEVVPDTWIAVVKGIDRFEGRSSLRTWVFRILTYQAKSRGERERRSIPMSALQPAGAGWDKGATSSAKVTSATKNANHELRRHAREVPSGPCGCGLPSKLDQ